MLKAFKWKSKLWEFEWQKSAKVGGADIESSCRSLPVAASNENPEYCTRTNVYDGFVVVFLLPAFYHTTLIILTITNKT